MIDEWWLAKGNILRWLHGDWSLYGCTIDDYTTHDCMIGEGWLMIAGLMTDDWWLYDWWLYDW